MIDCMKTTNYFAERRRMAKQQKDGICKLDCIDCPLSIMNNGTNVSCADFDKLYPEKAIAIVQRWSDEHPLGDDGTPDVCPDKLGLTDIKKPCFGDCV